MKEILEQLIELAKRAIEREKDTTAGLVNLVGMVLSLILVIALSLPAFFEALIRIIHPDVRIGTPLLQLFIAFVALVIICTAMLGYLEGPRPSSAGTKPVSGRGHAAA